MVLEIILLVLSIIALYYGAEFALESAELIGYKIGLSPLAIGLLLVGFGTSLPEFFVSQIATFNGVRGIALGNILGSNIANTLLILGVAGLLTPLAMNSKEVKGQLVFHVLVVLTLLGVITYSKIDYITLAIFSVLFLVYLYITFRFMEQKNEQPQVEKITIATIVKLMLGFGFLYGGGELLVYSGEKLGLGLGISPYVISAIFVAFGTSFPELVTTLIACRKKKDTDLIVGNIIGSNIFNIAFVLGSLGFYNFSIESSYPMEKIVLICSSLILLILGYMNRPIFKFVGGLFLIGYAASVVYWLK